jgi:hypothetical protein
VHGLYEYQLAQIFPDDNHVRQFANFAPRSTILANSPQLPIYSASACHAFLSNLILSLPVSFKRATGKLSATAQV